MISHAYVGTGEQSARLGTHVYDPSPEILANEIENQRPSRFAKGDKVDAMITELDTSKKKVVLSIKAMEEQQANEAVKKYGSKDSGGILGEILGPLIKNKEKNKK